MGQTADRTEQTLQTKIRVLLKVFYSEKKLFDVVGDDLMDIDQGTVTIVGVSFNISNKTTL